MNEPTRRTRRAHRLVHESRPGSPDLRPQQRHRPDPDAISGPAGACRSFALPVTRPFPWAALLEHLRTRVIPKREKVDAGTYVRAIPASNSTVEVRYDDSRSALVVTTKGPIDPGMARDRVAQLFLPAFDTQSLACLATDPMIGPHIARSPGLRPLGSWDPFELCVRTIVGQQVSVKAAESLIGRLAERCGAIEPAAVASATLDRIGMPGRRVAAIQHLARAVSNGELALDAPWPVLHEALVRRPGFGPWTRAYLGIRLGRDPDAFPGSDVGLLRASGQPDARRLEALAERWRPWRAYAATYLWMVVPATPHARR